MKRVCVRVCVLLAVLVAGQAGAASKLATVQPAVSLPVSFDLGGVPVMQFAQAIYRDTLARDFVVSSDLVDSQKKVSMRIKAMPADQLAGFVDQVLKSQGVAVTLKDGVYYLDAADKVQAGDAPSSAGPAGAARGAVPAGVDRDKAAADEKTPAVPDKFFVMRSQNRPVDFLVTTLNAIFGDRTARAGVGSLLVVGISPDREKAVRDVLAQIDMVPASVEVSASFVEVTRSKTDTAGLSVVAATIQRKLGVTLDTLNGQAVLQAGSYQAVLDALAGDSRFKQVSNSRVVGDEGEKLSLQVGDETPTVSSTSKDNAGNPVQNITYRPSGVILDVQPKVTGSGRLALTVDGQVSSFQTTVTGVSGSPTLVKREVKTAVSVDDGQVLVIGGLDDSKITNTNGGFSFLPASWRARSDKDTKTDLVLILTAHVIKARPSESL